MVGALGISLVLIFLILLFQFRNLKESLVVMASIPLSLFRAMLALILTSNPFGFTAFMGLISSQACWRDELKLKNDRLAAGLVLKRDVLETQAALIKTEVDLYAAQMAYRLALTELEQLTGIVK